MNDKLISSVIGNEEDLICNECKTNKKAKMSNYCLLCKCGLEPHFLEKFKHFRRYKNLECFTCFGCNKFFMEKEGYVTSYLLYLCKECYKIAKEG